jgi:hypothetical protein
MKSKRTGDEKSVEPKDVILRDTLPCPWAVVIHIDVTYVASIAVRAPQLAVHIAAARAEREPWWYSPRRVRFELGLGVESHGKIIIIIIK